MSANPIDLTKLTTPFPPAALKQREGSRGKLLTYVEGHTVIHRLNDVTNNQWDFKVIAFSTTPAGTSKSGAGQTLYTATVELCLPGLGCRQHVGVQLSTEGGGEDLVKGAVTDGLKKAATLFGIGLELYGPDYASDAERAGTGERPIALADRATSQPGQAATPRQLTFMEAVAREIGLSADDLQGELQQAYGRAAHELTRREASAFIERLQNRKASLGVGT